MRYGILVILTICALPAQAAMLDRAAFEPSQFLPPPPDEAATRRELAELHRIDAATGADRKAQARRDALDETPDIFNGAIGFDIASRPRLQALLQAVADERETDAKVAKTYFHRERPYSADSSIKSCEGPKKPGKAFNSYPSGHASLAYSVGIVLAQLLPDRAQAILARARDYSESRLICGEHYRSDIVASQQFGTLLALRLMALPAFQAQMDAVRQELAAQPPG